MVAVFTNTGVDQSQISNSYSLKLSFALIRNIISPRYSFIAFNLASNSHIIGIQQVSQPYRLPTAVVSLIAFVTLGQHACGLNIPALSHFFQFEKPTDYIASSSYSLNHSLIYLYEILHLRSHIAIQFSRLEAPITVLEKIAFLSLCMCERGFK